MKLKFLLPLALLLASFFAQNLAAQCQFTLNLYDSYGDGWTGNQLDITLGGGLPQSFTILPGTTFNNAKTATFLIDIVDNQSISVDLKTTFATFEISWALIDNNGDTVNVQAQQPAFGLASGNYFVGTTNCIECLGPKNVLVSNIYAYTTKIRWTSPEPGTFKLVYGTKDFNFAGGFGDTLTTSQYKATIPGLYENTPYEFYLWRDCGGGEASPVIGPIAFKTYFSDDIGISRVISPVSDCDLGNNEEIVVQIKNHGANPQSLIPFFYSVDGVSAGISIPTDGFYTGVVGKDSCEYIQFETLADLSGPGQHEIKVWTEMDNDDDPTNDTITYYLTNKIAVPYEQQFEVWHGAWYVDTASVNPSWEFGTPAKSLIQGAASGQNAWVTSLTGTYNNDETSYLLSPCFDFSGTTVDPTIRFSLWFDTEFSYDGLYLDMSIDNGDSWTRVGAINQPANTNWYNFTNTIIGIGDCWAGSSNGWVQARHKLDGAKGQSGVRLRFGFGSDDFVNFYNGAAVDDIRIYVPVAKDITAVKALVPGTGDCGSATDKLTVTIRNEGTALTFGFKAGFQIDNEPPFEENATGITLQPNTEKDFTFTKTINSIGQHTVKVWTKLTGDLNPANDTISYTFINEPAALPLKEDFESQQKPAGWISDFSVQVTNQHNAPSWVLAKNMYSFQNIFSNELPAIGPVSAGDTLSFDYRIVDYNFDQTVNGTEPTFLGSGTKFEVEISDNCGQTWQVKYLIDESTQAVSASMTTVKVPLGSFSGKIVKARITGEWQEGDFWFDTDNYNINGCPLTFGTEVEVNPDADPTQMLASATLIPKYGAAPFTYQWPGGATGPTQVGLEVGSYWVTITDKNGCSEVVYVEVEMPSATNDLPGLTRFSLAPNPTNGQTLLSLDFETPVSGLLEISNLLGQRILSEKMNESNEIRRQIDLEHRAAGIYLVRITVDGHSKTARLILTD